MKNINKPLNVEERLWELEYENTLLKKEVAANAKDKEFIRENQENLILLSIALSAEKNPENLLEQIVIEARRLTNADGGTLYIREEDTLEFHIIQNKSMDIRMGGTSGAPITFPPLQMQMTNVSSHVALTGKSVNIEDVYYAKEFDFSGPKNFDKANNYRSKSMLVIPLENHLNEIIGVLQLLNSMDSTTGEIVPFSEEGERWVRALASQAAVSLTNAQLIREAEELFNSLIKIMATAIDEKSPYSGGHIERVANITEHIVLMVNESQEGPYKDVHLTEDEIEEIKVAALLHDIGKITTPEAIMDKPTKLSQIFDRVEYVVERIKRIICEKEIEILKLERNKEESNRDKINNQLQQEIHFLKGGIELVKSCNSPGEYLDIEKVERLKELAEYQYIDGDGSTKNLLTEDELENLSIRKGSLNEKERKIIMDHVVVTIKLLKEIPFTRKLKNAPLYAGSHHEKLDGKGYPNGLTADELPIQSRILAFADIFEALSASDRPYKTKLSKEQVLSILGKMVEGQELDGDIYDLFKKENLYDLFEKQKEAPLPEGQ